MAFPKIAIIGAGPAGLTLARLLQHNTIPCSVFDLDADRHARTQGGTLDLHESTAQAALREAGLYDEFLAVARPEGEVLKVYDARGNLLMDEGESPGSRPQSKVRRPREFKNRPEVDRVQLRGMLLDSLTAGTVHWGHKLLRVEPAGAADGTSSSSSSYNLHFADGVGEKRGFDIVVGADGAWSRVRPLVSDARPLYSGITGLDIKISDAAKNYPRLSARVGAGMCLNLGSNKGILSQRNGDGAIRVYAFLRADQGWDGELGIDCAVNPGEAKRRVVQECFGDWDQEAKDLVLVGDEEEVCVRKMYMLPEGLRWAARSGITLIGDAAHLMTPFAGVGVNVAMQDALELARAIISVVVARKADSGWEEGGEEGGLAAALRAYEEGMFARAEQKAKETLMYLDLFFHEKGGLAMVEHFERVAGQGPEGGEE